MEEFNRSKMMSMNNSWDIPLAMEDSILQSNYGNSISNQMMISTGGITPAWSSFLVQSSHQHQAPSLAQISLSAGLHQLDVVGDEDEPEEELGAMKEMMYRIASMQPFDIDPSTICKPKRRNVRISDDPQSMVAKQRRERISKKIWILQRLVPGGTKMDTASMLDEAIHYVKFLKRQVQTLQSSSNHQNKSHLLWIPSIPILFGDPLQIPQSLSSSMELLLPATQHSITWSSNGGGKANVFINNKVIVTSSNYAYILICCTEITYKWRPKRWRY